MKLPDPETPSPGDVWYDPLNDALYLVRASDCVEYDYHVQGTNRPDVAMSVSLLQFVDRWPTRLSYVGRFGGSL